MGERKNVKKKEIIVKKEIHCMELKREDLEIYVGTEKFTFLANSSKLDRISW